MTPASQPCKFFSYVLLLFFLLISSLAIVYLQTRKNNISLASILPSPQIKNEQKKIETSKKRSKITTYKLFDILQITR